VEILAGGVTLDNTKRVVKFKRRKSINIGVVVFLILFLYIAIYIYIYFTKDKLSIYEVHEGTTAIDNHITGIILRDEKLINSEKAGYITYHQKEGARVAKNSAVYSVNESGQLENIVAVNDIPVTLSGKSYDKFKHSIKTFQKTFSSNDYSTVYKFKENIQNTALDIINETIMTQGNTIMENTDISYSNESGIITYYMDSYETLTPDTITPDMFKQENYKRISLRNAQTIERSSPVYKLITSESWSIILPLTKLQYEKLVGKEKASFTVLNDNFKITADLELLQPKNDAYYAQLIMNKYLSNYLDERFIDVELDFDSVDGLKIPASSVVEKEFYLVPIKFFAQGSDSKEMGLTKKTITEKGDITYSHVPTDIYYQDDNVAYIDKDLFPIGTMLQSPTNSDIYTLSEIGRLTGVYNVNQGYAVFRRIEELYHNDEYYIIKENTPNGVSVYDHIALDGMAAVDNAIIY
jgi:hypothetical protein